MKEANRLNYALEYSGANKSELNKVLTRFDSNSQDSLHYAAAKFLIENMPGHFSYLDPVIENYMEEIHAKFPNLSPPVKQVLLCLPSYFIYPDQLKKEEDIKVITSDFLIDLINTKIKLWHMLPWREQVSFDVFCEYILPHRIDHEPLTQIMNSNYDLSLDSLSKKLRYIHS